MNYSRLTISAFLMNLFQMVSKISEHLRRDPKGLYPYGKAFIKGLAYVVYYRVFRKNVTINPPFLVHCKTVEICGPGSVFIGKGCSVFANTFDRLVIVTLSPSATVVIGKGCDLGGVTIRCHHKVIVGDNVLSANCLIQDHLFSGVPSKALKDDVATAPFESDVCIGSGVWLAGQTIVLCGSNIGSGSVLSLGSVCCNFIVPGDHLAAGNLVSRSVSISGLNNILRNS